jgi:hypothetical protein
VCVSLSLGAGHDGENGERVIHEPRRVWGVCGQGLARARARQ